MLGVSMDVDTVVGIMRFIFDMQTPRPLHLGDSDMVLKYFNHSIGCLAT